MPPGSNPKGCQNCVGTSIFEVVKLLHFQPDYMLIVNTVATGQMFNRVDLLGTLPYTIICGNRFCQGSVHHLQSVQLCSTHSFDGSKG